MGAGHADIQEKVRESRGNFERDILQVHELSRSRWTFDLHAVAVEMVILFERLDEQVIDRKPNRSAPVRVAAKHARSRFRGLVLDPVLGAVDGEFVG
jgi:hypothetical protein